MCVLFTARHDELSDAAVFSRNFDFLTSSPSGFHLISIWRCFLGPLFSPFFPPFISLFFFFYPTIPRICSFIPSLYVPGRLFFFPLRNPLGWFKKRKAGVRRSHQVIFFPFPSFICHVYIYFFTFGRMFPCDGGMKVNGRLKETPKNKRNGKIKWNSMKKGGGLSMEISCWFYWISSDFSGIRRVSPGFTASGPGRSHSL